MSIKARQRAPGFAHARGVTLIELLMFMMIVAIALAAIVGVLRLNTANSADPLARKQALLLAEGLLEEVMQAKFSWCDPASPNAASAAAPADCAIPEAWGQVSPEPRGARPYDNINDYVSAPGVASAAFNIGAVLSDAAGRPVGLAGTTAQVTVYREALENISVPSGTSADVNVLRIRVTVTPPNDSPVVLDGYRTRYDPRGT